MRIRGVVKWFDETKGYGFLRPSDGSKDVFVHRSAIAGSGGERLLRDGQEVEFEVTTGSKGRPQAANVTTGTTGTTRQPEASR